MKATTLPSAPRGRLLRAGAAALTALMLSPAFAAGTGYDLDYTVGFLPDEGQAQVIVTATPGDGELREVKLHMPDGLYTDISGDGVVARDGDTVTWTLRRGEVSKLRYNHRVNNKRRGGGYDARLTAQWAILRGDDLVPARTVRATKGARSRARLHFALPPGWTGVDTPYVRSRSGSSFDVVNPERSFDRPVGWIVAGDIGARREILGGTHISVAGPKGGDLRRVDTLAFFNGLVPEFRKAFGDLPAKLLVVSAGDPMWRGGLSGPRSLFLHSDRPLISENGTSTLTHELTHVITRIRGADGDDWIAEGLAEYYSIELLRRASLLSEARAGRAQEWMRSYGKSVDSLTSNHSSGRRTARAVQLFGALDREIRTRTDDEHSLDDVVRALIPMREVSREDLRKQVEELTGEPSKVLMTALLD